jgi:dGTPase
MDWQKLLSQKRVKKLVEDIEPSLKMPGDKRDQFERDFDRVVFSTPFRRLQDKTQVFPLDPNDSIRTRLAHSLEVSHVARGLAKDVCCWMEDEGNITNQQSGEIVTVAATCGLLHDLGNPPFGHSGEEAIREWFKKKKFRKTQEQYEKDFTLFEGNAQTIRLVAKLQILADYHGLNLTCGTLSAACKYTATSDKVNEKIHEKSKFGYFASEHSLIKKLREETGTGNARNPITFLVEVADDSVYNTVDLEDGITKRILDWEQLKKKLKSYDDHSIKECIKYAESQVKKGDLQLEGHAQDCAHVQYFRVRAIGKIVTAAAEAFKNHSVEIMRGEYHGELVEDSCAATLVAACKKINRKQVYRSDETLKLELMGRKVIHDLLDIFWEGANEKSLGRSNTFASKAYNLLSDNYRKVFKHELDGRELPKLYCRKQLVTDYICGMTDTFAVNLHKRLTNG